MILCILVVSCFIYFNHIRTSNHSSGNDDRIITNTTEELLKKEKIMQHMKNMKYLNILIDENLTEESKMRFIQDTADEMDSINPMDIYGGGLQNDF